MKRYIELFAIFMMLVTSGGLAFQRGTAFIYLILCLLVWYMNKGYNKNNVTKKNVLYLVPIVLWPLINDMIIHTPLEGIMSELVTMIRALGVFFLVSSLDFDYFRHKTLKVFTILSAVSIVAQIGFNFFGLGGTWYDFGEFQRYMVWGIFNMNDTYTGYMRLSSVYWEPGQYMIVIFYVLSLFVDELSDWSRIKANLKKFGVLFVALLMTLSTTAYLTLILFFVVLFFGSTYKKQSKLLLLAMLCLIGTASYFLLYSSTVQDKFDDKSEKSSYTIRMMDNVASLEQSLSSPFVGHGSDNCMEYKKVNEATFNTTSSNGWLRTSAQQGFPYALFIFFLMIKGIKRMNLNVSPLLVFSILFLCQCNEAQANMPYIWMYTFVFCSYNNKLVQK